MRTLILGFDAFDPEIFESLSAAGRLPHLTRYVDQGGYARFRVVNPPQTEVSWTSIATGANPGAHAIFDFVHRDPASYTPYLSLLPTKSGLLGTRFIPPYKTDTIFSEATRQGFPATALWWPATFPARPELPVHTLPGLGTPDIQGRWGVGTFFTRDPEALEAKRKTLVSALQPQSRGRYVGRLNGPVGKTRGGKRQAGADFTLELSDREIGQLKIGRQDIELHIGQWSPIFEVSFKMGIFLRVHALTRAILTQASSDVRLYFLPLQLHPLHSPWRYATPGSFAKEIWQGFGPFLTLGWPQDTTALEEDCIDGDQFLVLCDTVFDARMRILMHQLEGFDEGVLASVFDSLDRVQHMFRRDRPDIVATWYEKLDRLVGVVQERLAGQDRKEIRVLVVSDHGFSDFNYKVHLNRWLIDQGYLVSSGSNGSGALDDVDWARTQAYAVGLNSLYLNLAGREGQGAVAPEQYEAAVDQIRQALLSWQGPDGGPVVRSALRQAEAFQGPFAGHGPDIVVGFSPGYRASAETGLGKWGGTDIEPNRDHWGADHCVDAASVPGVLFCSHGLQGSSNPSYHDFPSLAIGKDLGGGGGAPPPHFSDEDQEVLEERLRSLGYL
jgi:predicted AlkP superfamily phosphohydrolase/phosphomutase